MEFLVGYTAICETDVSAQSRRLRTVLGWSRVGRSMVTTTSLVLLLSWPNRTC